VHTLTLLIKSGSNLGVEARLPDHPSWDCFLKGWLCALWVEHRARHIQQANLTQLANFWAQGLMQQLLQMTHYRNTTVHLEVKEGRTAAAHETILETMEGFLYTDPEQLLEEHCHLLFSHFAAFASSPIKDKLEWISEIDSALGATSHMACVSRHAVQTKYCQGHRPHAQTEYELVMMNAEGSM
jgi:hypothetical protein